MIRQIRVWSAGALTATALLGLEVALAAAVRANGREVLAPGPATLDQVIATLAAAAALLLGAWLAVSSTAAVLAHAPGRLGTAADRLAATWAPLLTRRAAAVLVGAAVSSTLAPATALANEGLPAPGFSVTAGAATGAAHADVPRDARLDALPAAHPNALLPAQPVPGWSATPQPTAGRSSAPPAGWTPTRPAQRPVSSPGLVTSGATAAGGREVVVHRGDTLWDLVAAHLGPDATDAEVAAAWPRWHDTNRSVIGDDPDRLLPGQVLRVPSPAVSR